MVAPRQSPGSAGFQPASETASPSLDTFLAELLSDQQQLQTPVTRAATAHALQPSAWRAEKFRELVPLTAPGPGRQYAFEVDLDSCSGCKACVSGCHSLNGLDDEETWRDVGVVYGLSALTAPGSAGLQPAPFAQTVTTACHHCEDPACLNGCPVLAYEKDPITGIVRHLDDQCIGCSYCVLKCPYEVPKYNQSLGIVRKCDMCHGRLADGEAPACAQACPTQAIRIVTVSTAASSPYDAVVSLPADPAYTRPTTRYVSKNPLPSGLRAADAATPRPQHAHLALVFLLTGTQLALGLMASAKILNPNYQTLNIAAAVLFFAALAASVAHLGQPLRAWRVFLGLRRSWLSREAVVLGGAAPFVAIAAAWPWLHEFVPGSAGFQPAFQIAAIALIALGVFCSAMIYIDTRRHFWRPANTFLRMGGTVLIATLAFLSPPVAALALALKLALERRLLRASPISARLHAGPLRTVSRARLAFGLAALVLFALQQPWFGFVLFAVGELLERVLYFQAVDAPKMPGQPAV
jgi:formate dehydrogenase iron-sulfur subunit